MTAFTYIGPFVEAEVYLPTRTVIVGRGEDLEALDNEVERLDSIPFDWKRAEDAQPEVQDETNENQENHE